MTALFKVIGSGHGVTDEQVRRSVGHRRTSMDLAVVLSFMLLFGLGATLVTRRIVCRYPAEDGWIEPVVMTALAAIAGSGFAVLAGEEWSLLIETLRVGNGHLSYRVERIPWTRHRPGLFLGGVILFGLIAGIQYYRVRVRGYGQPHA